MIQMQADSHQAPVFVPLRREFCVSVVTVMLTKYATESSVDTLCPRVKYWAKLVDVAPECLHGINFFFKRIAISAPKQQRTAYEDLVRSVDEERIDKVHDIAKVEGRFIYLVSLKKEPVWNKCWVEKVPPDALRWLRMNR